MSDESIRAARRAALAKGSDDMGRAAREELRVGQGLAGHLYGLVGTWVYVEGARMNYRGILVDVFTSPTGELEAVALEPCWRVGWWNEKPKKGYNFKLAGRHVVPWDAVQAIGPPSPRQGGTSYKIEDGEGEES